MIESSPELSFQFVDDGTESPQATGHDEMFPRDCGRDPDEGTGKLCFPDGLLCQNSKCRLELININSDPTFPPSHLPTVTIQIYYESASPADVSV